MRSRSVSFSDRVILLTNRVVINLHIIPIAQIKELCQLHHINKFALFGSVLRDDFTPNSDIDVLVEFQVGYTPGFFKLHQIQEEISQLFDGRKIDLVTPKFLNYQIRDQILDEMEVCYVAEG